MLFTYDYDTLLLEKNERIPGRRSSHNKHLNAEIFSGSEW